MERSGKWILCICRLIRWMDEEWMIKGGEGRGRIRVCHWWLLNAQVFIWCQGHDKWRRQTQCSWPNDWRSFGHPPNRPLAPLHPSFSLEKQGLKLLDISSAAFYSFPFVYINSIIDLFLLLSCIDPIVLLALFRTSLTPLPQSSPV